MIIKSTYKTKIPHQKNERIDLLKKHIIDTFNDEYGITFQTIQDTHLRATNKFSSDWFFSTYTMIKSTCRTMDINLVKNENKLQFKLKITYWRSVVRKALPIVVFLSILTFLGVYSLEDLIRDTLFIFTFCSIAMTLLALFSMRIIKKGIKESIETEARCFRIKKARSSQSN